MPKWEYLIVDIREELFKPYQIESTVNSPTEVLNNYGNAGWELVSVTEYGLEEERSHKAYFKRILPDTQ